MSYRCIQYIYIVCVKIILYISHIGVFIIYCICTNIKLCVYVYIYIICHIGVFNIYIYCMC